MAVVSFAILSCCRACQHHRGVDVGHCCAFLRRLRTNLAAAALISRESLVEGWRIHDLRLRSPNEPATARLTCVVSSLVAPLTMRVRSSLKKICKSCQIVKRGRNVYVICPANSRHKQRAGFATLATTSVDMTPQSPINWAAMTAALPMLTPGTGIITSMGLPSWAKARGSAEVDGPFAAGDVEDL